MKIYTIGRGETNAIHIDNEYVSRQHALLKVYPSGKMEIIDKSSNGTAINGRKLKPNVPYRVRRKDVVTFASQAHLDWGEVPDPLKGYKIAVLCIVIIAILAGAFFSLKPLFNRGASVDTPAIGGSGGDSGSRVEVVPPADTAKKVDESPVDVEAELKKMAAEEKKRRREAERKKKAEEKKLAEKEKARQDSLKKATAEKADSSAIKLHLGL